METLIRRFCGVWSGSVHCLPVIRFGVSDYNGLEREAKFVAENIIKKTFISSLFFLIKNKFWCVM